LSVGVCAAFFNSSDLLVAATTALIAAALNPALHAHNNQYTVVAQHILTLEGIVITLDILMQYYSITLQ
jgi:hypothetical protein